jgi:hypothetical protein
MRSCEHSDEECKNCMLERWGSVTSAASATPSRRINRDRPKDKPLYNSWEAGVPTDGRGMPFLNEHGAVVHQKEYAENRRKWRR